MGQGPGASPGAAVGRIYFTADDAAEAAARGEQVVLVRNETSPEDVHGMLAAEGILTARGGLVSHAAVVARGWGKPAVVGAEVLRLGDHQVTANGVTLYEGDWVSLDGGAGDRGGGPGAADRGRAAGRLRRVLSWADDIRKGHLAVRANADTGDDAANARKLGAEGIGLCRTEHMFLAEDRLPVVRRMILAHSPSEEADALEELRVVQREDFISILAAMDGLPVTVRLLDPPLHEFLPSTEELAHKDATVGLDPEERRLYEAALSWQESNPMLGTRGVRLGVVKPGLYAMQVRALMEAARQRVADGGHPIVEIMIPLTVTRAELALAHGWVEDALADVYKENAPRRPRGQGVNGQGGQARGDDRDDDRDAASRAARRGDRRGGGLLLLRHQRPDPDDLRLSRDDVEGRMMDAYLELGLLPRNPFEVVDFDGVGELVRLGTARGRATKPTLKVGVCGEHGGDPASIALFYDAGLDYVSCSPFRVPVARLAAAQAVLAEDEAKADRRRPRRSSSDQGRGRRLPRAAGDHVAAQGDDSPDRLDDAEGPRPREEAVGAGQGATDGEGQDERPAARLQGVHPHHEGQGADAIDGDRHPTTLAPFTAPDMAAVPSGCGDTGRGSGPGPGGHRHRGPHQRARLVEEGGPALERAVPVPRREDAFVQRQRRRGLLLLLRLSGLGRRHHLRPRINHLDFVDAVRLLADRAGITLHEDQEQGRGHKRRSELLEAMERAVAWYHERLLRSPDAGPAREYLRSRGYDGDVVRQFRLGWAPDDWEALAKALKLLEKVMSDSGLGFVNRRGRAQDFFRSHILFPICDPSGRPSRWGGAS